MQYHDLLAVGQAVVDAQVQRPWRERLMRKALTTVLPSRWFGAALAMGRIVRPMLPKQLQERIPLRPPLAPPAWPDRKKSMHARQVLLLKGCVQRSLRPHVDATTARVLDVMGIRAGVSRSSGCCGAIQGHLGDLEGAKQRARQNIDAWWPWVESKTPAEAILINASGCGAWVKDYGLLLADDPAYADKAKRIAALAKDPGELLPSWLPFLKRKLARRPDGASLGVMTFHPPCSLSHVHKLSSAAKPGPIEQGLRELGFEVNLAQRDSHQCCGAGGAYSVTQPVLSRQLRDLKIKALEETEPHVIASANIGCIVHLQSGTNTPVKHWIEMLDEALTRQQSPGAGA